MKPPLTDTGLIDRLARLHRERPGRGASGAEHAAWLRRKADVSDAIASNARQCGNVPAAVRAEVEASRARIDARLFDRSAGDRGRAGVDPPRPRAAERAATADSSAAGH